MAIAVVVDWWGPYKGTADLQKRGGPEWLADAGVKALYLALGAHNVCHYVGRTGNIKIRLRHHDKLASSARLFVGKVSSPGIPGPKQMKVPADLDLAEKVLVFVLQPQDNSNLKQQPPKECGIVFSRLFDPDSHDQPVFAIPAKFPVLVAYDPATDEAILIRGRQKRKRVSPE